MDSAHEKMSEDSLLYFKSQLEWCLHQYASDSDKLEEKEGSYLPDWAAFRTLQNQLIGILNHSNEINSVAISSLIVSIFSRVFSDLCSDTPWDKDQLINNARRAIHSYLLKLLEGFNLALEVDSSSKDALLWQAYSDFEFNYNKILCQLNEEDQVMIDKITEKP